MTILRRFVFFLSFILLVSASCEAQTANKSGLGPAPKRGIFHIFRGKGKQKPKSVAHIQKEQDKKDKKKQAEYAKSIKQNQQRSFQIQTPEVQTRMKQNQKDITDREKARKKKVSSSSKKVRKKYK
jgi:negative regulator of sigma E activity